MAYFQGWDFIRGGRLFKAVQYIYLLQRRPFSLKKRRHKTLKENIILSPFFQCDSEKNFVQVMVKYEKNRRIR